MAAIARARFAWHKASGAADCSATVSLGRAALLPISRLLLMCLLSIGVVVAPALAAEVEFPEWLDGVRQEALASGISAPTVDLARGALGPIPRVIELDRRQPEATQTYQQYLEHVVNPRRKHARQQLAGNRDRKSTRLNSSHGYISY